MALHIDIHDPVPECLRGVFGSAVALRRLDADIVENHVQSAVCFDRRINGVARGFTFANVTLDVATMSPGCLDSLHGFSTGGIVNICDDDGGTLPPKGDGSCLSHSHRAPGNDHHFADVTALRFAHVRSSPSLRP